LVLTVVALAISNVLISGEKDQKAQALQDKEAALVTARINEGLAEGQRRLAVEQEEVAQGQKARAEEGRRLTRRHLYAAQMNLARQAWDQGDAQQALELLEAQRPLFGEEDLRSFDWFYLWRLWHPGHQLTL